ncbi:MAG: GspE/PulE family protein [Pseudomonadota bacterium]
MKRGLKGRVSTVSPLDDQSRVEQGELSGEKPLQIPPKYDETVFLAHLEDNELITSADRVRVLSITSQTDEQWDQVLCRLGLVTEKKLTQALSEYVGWPTVDDTAQTFLDPRLNPLFLTRHRIVCLSHDGPVAKIGFVNPFNAQGIGGIRFALGDFSPVLITQSDFDLLDQSVDIQTSANEPTDFSMDMERLADIASSEPVVRRVNGLVARASRTNASDIHIEPSENAFSIRYRIDGVLRDTDSIGLSEGLAVVSRLKILSSLDIAERRRAQDGRFTFPVEGRNIDIRVSTVPTDHGESVVLRLLDKQAVALNYATLGYSEEQARQITKIIHEPNGLVLLTGPTGSGKTTTLYTFLSDLADGTRKILTIEDPVEYRLPNVLQSQVNPQIDVSFSSALRSFLRHDPDVMMVGEIRDKETAQIAIQAALTGHMVLSTLHTNDAASAITRLRDLGIADYLIASTLKGVISQRLVLRHCAECAGLGCVQCNDLGTKGRVAIAEILQISDDTKEAIRTGKSETKIKQSDRCFIPIIDDAKKKIAAGLTSDVFVRRTLGTLDSIT